MRRWTLAAAGLAALGCAGVPPWLGDRERDVRSDVQGGGTVTVSCTGAFEVDETLPGATPEQLRALESTRLDLEARHAVRWEVEGREWLELSPGKTNAFGWHGEAPAKVGDWWSLSLESDGSLRGSLGLYLDYPADSGWHLVGDGPPVDLSQPGSVRREVRIDRAGLPWRTVGRGTCEVSWALDDAVRHTWVRHYVPRRH